MNAYFAQISHNTTTSLDIFTSKWMNNAGMTIFRLINFKICLTALLIVPTIDSEQVPQSYYVNTHGME